MVFVTGCGASVTLSSSDAAVATDVPTATDVGLPTDLPTARDLPTATDVVAPVDRPSTQACALPLGGTCPVGTSCPAGDGCNTCACGAGGVLACTGSVCPRDAGSTTCRSTADCPAGQLCDGPAGCAVPWTCRPRSESCTMDLAPFCGCDGTTFSESSTCPGRPYRHMGPCSMSIIACVLPSGARCPLNNTCPSGDGCNDCTCGPPAVLRCTTRPCAFDAGPPRPQCSSVIDCRPGEECAGPEGCAVPWTCRAESDRICSDDVVPWCGCDGRTFYGSSTCPPQRYASRGACGAMDAGAGPSFDCDPSHATCTSVPASCPSGQVRAVTAGCWGACVDFAGCAPIACDPALSRPQCPDRAICDPDTRRCRLATP